MDVLTLLSQVKRLPPNPQVMLKLMKLLQDIDSGPYQIVNLIKVDPTLAAQVLRIANSAFYGATEPTHDLEEAVNRIGFRETYKLVGAVCSSQMFGAPPLPTYPGSDKLWDHSIAIALMMEDLAPRVGLDTASTYTIGLLHSLGKVMINQAVSGKYVDIYKLIQEEKLSLIEAETRVLGFTHVDVGVALLKKWYTPPTILSPIQNQFTPLLDKAQTAAACVLHLSISTVQAAEPAPGHLTRSGNTYQEALLKVSLTDEALDASYQRIQKHLQNIKELLVISKG
jgi:HD-like signal output (HDOD) protein